MLPCLIENLKVSTILHRNQLTGKEIQYARATIDLSTLIEIHLNVLKTNMLTEQLTNESETIEVDSQNRRAKLLL